MIDIHRMVLATDWPAVRHIYADGLATGLAAFSSNPPSQHEWDRAHLPFDRLVARLGDAVHGWAAFAPVADTCGAASVAEVSVYVNHNAQGKGVGAALILGLIGAS